MTLFAKKVVNEQIGAELTESGKQGCRKCRATVKARLEMAAPPDQFGLRLIGSNQLSVPPELIEDKSKTLFQGLPMRAIALLISAVRPHAGKDLAIGSQLTLPTRLTGFKPQFAGDHFRIERPTHDSEFDRKEMPSHRNGFLFGVFRQIDAPSSPNWASKLLSPCAALPKGHESAAKDAERSTFIKLDSIQPLDEFQFRGPFTWKEWHDPVDRVVFEYCDGEGLHPEFRTVDVGINTRGTPHRTLAILRW